MSPGPRSEEQKPGYHPLTLAVKLYFSVSYQYTKKSCEVFSTPSFDGLKNRKSSVLNPHSPWRPEQHLSNLLQSSFKHPRNATQLLFFPLEHFPVQYARMKFASCQKEKDQSMAPAEKEDLMKRKPKETISPSYPLTHGSHQRQAENQAQGF